MLYITDANPLALLPPSPIGKVVKFRGPERAAEMRSTIEEFAPAEDVVGDFEDCETAQLVAKQLRLTLQPCQQRARLPLPGCWCIVVHRQDGQHVDYWLAHLGQLGLDK